MKRKMNYNRIDDCILVEIPSLVEYVSKVQAQGRPDDESVMLQAVATGYLLSPQGKEAGEYMPMYSSDLKRLFPEPMNVAFVSDVIKACFTLSDELVTHVESDAPASMDSYLKADKLGKWTLLLAILVGEGFVRLVTKREMQKLKTPTNKSMQMLESLYKLLVLPSSTTSTVMGVTGNA